MRQQPVESAYNCNNNYPIRCSNKSSSVIKYWYNNNVIIKIMVKWKTSHNLSQGTNIGVI